MQYGPFSDFYTFSLLSKYLISIFLLFIPNLHGYGIRICGPDDQDGRHPHTLPPTPNWSLYIFYASSKSKNRS